jgi:alkylation response protein AidB-like acyl-CoA dehydrogenase
MTSAPLRHQNFSLDPDQQVVRETFADFFAKEASASVVREAEPLGFSAELWAKLAAMGVPSMGLPASAGGDDATLIDLALVAEEQGRAVAPVPLVSHVAATRLLVRAGGPAEVLTAAATGDRLLSLALHPVRTGARQLVPDAAIARDVLAWSPEGLAVYSTEDPAPHVPNQGSTPLAWFEPERATRTELATGSDAQRAFRHAVAEWKVLMAAALVGVAESSLRLGVEFARSRRTMGVPIGELQGVSFPLADIATALAGARNLVWKAAWFTEHEPEARPDLPLIAFDYAARTVTDAAWISAHMQGGLGFTIEADISLYFLRAKGWSVLAGDRSADRRLIAATRIHNA